MASRDDILAKVRANKPDLLPLPDVPLLNGVATPTFDRFADVLAFVGGRLALLPSPASLADFVRAQYPAAGRVASSVPLAGVPALVVDADTDRAVLEGIDLAVLRGEFGVAENAAVWVPEANMLHRALPFIAQHLLLVIDPAELVNTMHEAYRLIDRQTLSYGVFISGPSKTADIEQSLVIGAHGARSLTVVLRQQVSPYTLLGMKPLFSEKEPAALTTFQLNTCQLRPWREGDEDCLSRYASNRNIWNNVRDFFPNPYSHRDAHSWVRSNKAYLQPNNLAIEVDGQAVGNVGFTVKDDIYRFNAEIGYWLSEHLWGKGIMTEVLPVMVDYMFRNFQLTRIYACVLEGNAGSMRVLHQAGFRAEAVLRKATVKNNQYLDEHIYALLREEYLLSHPMPR